MATVRRATSEDADAIWEREGRNVDIMWGVEVPELGYRKDL